MSHENDDVQPMADQLRQYATHFEMRDWEYTRDLGDLRELRCDREGHRMGSRLRRFGRWLVCKPKSWERQLGIKRFSLSMALCSLKRPSNLPDGGLDNGAILTFWEETGEYLQYVQPSVGVLLADLMEAHPDLPQVKLLASEMKRINDNYSSRNAEKEIEE